MRACCVNSWKNLAMCAGAGLRRLCFMFLCVFCVVGASPVPFGVQMVVVLAAKSDQSL